MEATTSLGSELQPSSRAYNLLVGADVEIHESAVVGANVVLCDGVKVGAGVQIKHNAVIGERPSLAVDSRADIGPDGPTRIEEGATVCIGAVVLAGATVGAGSIIGDQTYLREGVDIGEDVVVGRGCAIGAGASLGARVKIQSGTIILPRMTVEEDVLIGSMVGGATDNSIGAVPDLARQRVVLRRGCRIGSCVCLLPGVEVGESALVGAGAVVRESVAPFSKVAGVPARVIGTVDDA